MLQSATCRHSLPLPVESCLLCSSTAPEPLMELCLDYILNHLDTICEFKSNSDQLRLHDNIALPIEICERLLMGCLNKNKRQIDSFINIFRDRQCTRLKRVKLHNTDIEDKSVKVLLQHRLTELDLTNCTSLSEWCLRYITVYGGKLQSLTIGENTNIFPNKVFITLNCDVDYFIEKGYIILAPNLRRLSIKNIYLLQTPFYMLLLKPLENLTYLDLSNCSKLGNFNYAEHLVNLTSLILYNVDKIKNLLPSVCKLKNLRHLDISQSKEEHGMFENGSQLLQSIVEDLTKLVSLDISGTNLAGRGVAEPRGTVGSAAVASDIPGLVSRVNNPFQFLGLYDAQHDACLRHDIPAKLIAGNANEEQVLIAALAYLDRPEMLQKVLNELFHFFRFESCQYVGQALNVVLESMDRHINERHIQISGSATLFYIVKGAGKELHDVVRIKRRIITTLLNGMFAHKSDDTMMRNGCLTLCQFKIPQDVIFQYERLVDILLHSVYGMQQESFVQRIGIYLLNSLACQVDGVQKVKLGELGAINKMLWLIADRLERVLCDDVLEVAWSTMWNVTDETPANCKKFLENKGMEYFLKCLEKFPDKEELLRNMMGLLGNVAEVKELRHYLMTPEYVTVFSNLLDSISDGIEVSYNAAGVLSHMASDGPDVWTILYPTRETVLGRMVCAIERWDLASQRNINYRSFEPILNLVRVYETPECQYWAVWALANLTKVYPEKYCALIESEGGLALLQEVVNHPAPPARVKQLAATVHENCRHFREHYIDSDSLLDG
ncbi:hypothetical protein FQA39_LY12219 [Lamprigera yunnana]|nr:hypothetical protein FQA39_LY12219 [Lamprigera yunnana]